jgi:hypothetical protein
MAGQEYKQGQLLRVTFTFKTGGVTLMDPAVVKFEYKKPGAAATTYTYPTNIAKDSTGTYHVDLDLDTSGAWVYRAYSTGLGQAAEDGDFTVKADPVA